MRCEVKILFLALERAFKTAQNIIGIHLLSISDIGEVRCLRRAQKILKDNSHLSHGLVTLLLAGRRYRSIHIILPIQQ